MPTQIITPKDKGKTQYIHRSAGIVESKKNIPQIYNKFYIQR